MSYHSHELYILIYICAFCMQDDEPEQILNTSEDKCKDASGEAEGTEFGLELAQVDMDIVEDDESADTFPEDVLIIDSEDGIDEDTVPSTETDNEDSKPQGVKLCC